MSSDMSQMRGEALLGREVEIELLSIWSGWWRLVGGFEGIGRDPEGEGGGARGLG